MSRVLKDDSFGTAKLFESLSSSKASCQLELIRGGAEASKWGSDSLRVAFFEGPVGLVGGKALYCACRRSRFMSVSPYFRATRTLELRKEFGHWIS